MTEPEEEPCPHRGEGAPAGVPFPDRTVCYGNGTRQCRTCRLAFVKGSQASWWAGQPGPPPRPSA